MTLLNYLMYLSTLLEQNIGVLSDVIRETDRKNICRKINILVLGSEPTSYCVSILVNSLTYNISKLVNVIQGHKATRIYLSIFEYNSYYPTSCYLVTGRERAMFTLVTKVDVVLVQPSKYYT